MNLFILNPNNDTIQNYMNIDLEAYYVQRTSMQLGYCDTANWTMFIIYKMHPLII